MELGSERLMEIIDRVSRHFGVVFKEKQVDAVQSFMTGRDVFVSLPTGYGKSLIYGCLPFAFDILKAQEGSVVVCVSPLISLMMDQKARFTPKGIDVEFIGEDQKCIRKVLAGDVQLVYISPESLMCNAIYRNMLLSPVYKEKLVALVVDEAHCVKSWGDKFRLAYAHLGDIRSLLPSHVNVMALTATATHDTYGAVIQRLSMRDVILIGCEPNRANISFAVEPKSDVEVFCSNVASGLRSLGTEYPKTVIFVRSYSDCSLLYHTLRRQLGPCITSPPDYPLIQQFTLIDMYNGAATINKKEQILNEFCKEKGTLRVVIATIAFGMGVDCSDIRVVIHWGHPSTLEQYVQEIGRAGRDNLPSKAILYYGKPGKFVCQDVRDYTQNHSNCRREILFKNFLFSVVQKADDGIDCCDICKRSY